MTNGLEGLRSWLQVGDLRRVNILLCVARSHYYCFYLVVLRLVAVYM